LCRGEQQRRRQGRRASARVRETSRCSATSRRFPGGPGSPWLGRPGVHPRAASVAIRRSRSTAARSRQPAREKVRGEPAAHPCAESGDGEAVGQKLNPGRRTPPAPPTRERGREPATVGGGHDGPVVDAVDMVPVVAVLSPGACACARGTRAATTSADPRERRRVACSRGVGGRGLPGTGLSCQVGVGSCRSVRAGLHRLFARPFVILILPCALSLGVIWTGRGSGTETQTRERHGARGASGPHPRPRAPSQLRPRAAGGAPAGPGEPRRASSRRSARPNADRVADEPESSSGGSPAPGFPSSITFVGDLPSAPRTLACGPAAQAHDGDPQVPPRRATAACHASVGWPSVSRKTSGR